ncbi:MAG: hypothetical protein JXA33_02015 [Anaerolineae bacterium]|nr:hypothetical protein [Anaerolineae bacterium]
MNSKAKCFLYGGFIALGLSLAIIFLTYHLSPNIFFAIPCTRPSTYHTDTGWVLTLYAAGPYWLGSEWWHAQGIDPETLSADKIQLMQAGEVVPFLWLAEESGLLFLGKVAETRYGPRGSYTLTLDIPASMNGMPFDNRVSGQIVPSATFSDLSISDIQQTTLVTSWLERDEVYRSTAPMDRPWFWTTIHAPGEFVLTVPLTAAVSSPVSLTLRMWGQSSMPQNPDHHIRVWWDDRLIDEHWWDGSEVEMWTVRVTEAQSDVHTLRLESPGSTEIPVEVTWLDAVGVTWQRTLPLPETGWATWQADGSARACWSVSETDQHEKNETEKVRVLWEIDDNIYDGGSYTLNAGQTCIPQIGIAANQTGTPQGWIGVPRQAPPPDESRPRELVDIVQLETAQYLIIAPRVFHEALSPLLAMHESEGLTTALVTPEQVYDTFGIRGERAIREWRAIQNIVNTLHTRGRLRYLLLVGDASANQFNSQFSGIPTAWVRTSYVGDTPSDYALVLDEEGEPLIAVGRFPANSIAEVRAMVDKTLAWKPATRLAYLVDDEPEFAGLVDLLSEIIPGELQLAAAKGDTRDGVLRWLQAGPGTLVYSGHGSLLLLGDEKILTAQDAGNWNGPTVVVAWTCLCAMFTHPQYIGIAEAWLRNPRGTVAFVGPTAETTTTEQRAMALAFQHTLLEGATLGDALLSGWRAAQSQDVKGSFLLLGDPALRPFPRDDL